jgi:hypothetical protein
MERFSCASADGRFGGFLAGETPFSCRPGHSEIIGEKREPWKEKTFSYYQ